MNKLIRAALVGSLIGTLLGQIITPVPTLLLLSFFVGGAVGYLTA